MGYLGNTPGENFITFSKQVFTIVNSQTAYTLDFAVVDENELRLVINNVVQEPGTGKAYTASGTTLTLASALTNGTDEMYCVFLGKARETVTVPTITRDKLNLISDGSNPSLIAKGTSGVSEGYIQLNCAENSHGVKIKSPPHSAGQSYTLTLPQSITNNTFLKTDGSGNLSFAAAGGVNTPVVNAIRFGTSQAISATTWTRIVFNSERLDTGSIYDNSTGVATIAEAGKYLVMSTIGVRNLTGSSEYFGAAIQNTDRTQAGIDSIAAYVSGASGYGWKNIHLSHIKSYSANDTIAIWCYATEAVDLVDESQNLTICKIIE